MSDFKKEITEVNEALDRAKLTFNRMQKAHKAITAAWVDSKNAIKEFEAVVKKVEQIKISAKMDDRSAKKSLKMVTLVLFSRIIDKYIKRNQKTRNHEKFINVSPDLDLVIYKLGRVAEDSEQHDL